MFLSQLRLHGPDGEDRMHELQDVLLSALDGNALYEIEQASQQLRDDLGERAYYAKHNPLAAE